MHNLPHDHGQNIEAILLNSPSSDDFFTVSNIFQQLSDPKRLQLFWILCHCEECVINLSAMMNMSSPAISHHLRQLKVHGLIISSRHGKEVYYKASKSTSADALHKIIEQMIVISCPDNN